MKEEILKEIVDNTCKLINIKTIKDEYIEFDKAFSIIKNELKEYNIKEIMVGNYKNLVITNTNSNNLDIIFCGHIDVVPASYYEASVKDGCIYGRGSFDMKSQLSVMISLLKNNKSNKKIGLIITSDEEIGGYCCKEILNNYNASLAVIPDASKNFELIVEEKGLLQVLIKTSGIKAHASEPFNGENAIVKAYKIYEELLKIYKMPNSKDEYITSVNLSKMSGGTTNNMVADEAEMVLDIRFTNDDSKESILSNIKKVLVNSTIEVLDYGPTFYVNHELNIIKDFINKTEKILGKKVIINKCCATSDAIYFSEKKIPTILMNPIGDFWHNDNEYVNIDSLYTLYCIFKELL